MMVGMSCDRSIAVSREAWATYGELISENKGKRTAEMAQPVYHLLHGDLSSNPST